MCVLNENIRFCHFGTSQQYHIYTERVSIYSIFVCPVHDSPGNTDTNPLRAHFYLSATFTHDICKFSYSLKPSFYSKARVHPPLKLLAGPLCAWWDHYRGNHRSAPSSGISTRENHGKEQGLCSLGHISVGLWMQMQEVDWTLSLLFPIRSHSKLDITWPFITVFLVCPGLTILPYTTILM